MKKLYTFALAAMVGTAFAMADAGYSMLNYTVSPASGSTVKSLTEISITFPDTEDGVDSHIINSNIGNYATLTCGETVIKAIKLEAGTRSNTQEAIITFPETTAAGTYVFNLAEGTIKDYLESEMADEGESYSVNPPITATYTIEGAHVPETTMSVYEIDPADGATLTGIHVINILFPMTSTKDGIEAYTSTPTAYLEKDGAVVATTTNLEVGGSYDQVQITFDSTISEAGTYTFRLPAETYYDYSTSGDDAVSNPEITATYTISGSTGIENVAVDSVDKTTVYDLYGRKVSADRLPAGIYIVNGKKTAVR